jgi:hypothetical protein
MFRTHLAICLAVAMLLLVTAAWPGTKLGAADEPAAAPTLLAPPDETAQADATKLIRELFGTQIDAAKTSIAKDELAKKLLQQGIDSKADPAGQFVLFRMARDLAVGVGDPAVALQAIDETARIFRLDAASLRQETLAALAKTAINPLQSRALADAAWSALDEAVAADNFEVAKLLAAQGITAAKRVKGDPDVLRQWAARAKEIDELESVYDEAQPSIVKLAQKPLDPAANMTVGRYRVFVKGDWDRGLPMIALGKDSPLQALAVAEMSPPQEAEAQLKLADEWSDLADNTPDASEKARLQGRAMFWYGQSLPNLSGLPKAKVEKRLQEVTRDIFKRVQAAMRGSKVVYSPTVGTNRGGPFIDRPDEGGLLVGFEIGVGSGNDGGLYIRAIRPLFATSHGDTQGSMHGNARGDVITVRAREGFAVGGLTIKAANRIDGLSVTFMQIQGAGLDSRNAYTSDWYGSRTSGGTFRLGGSGSPMIGIVGKADNSLQELQLVQAR